MATDTIRALLEQAFPDAAGTVDSCFQIRASLTRPSRIGRMLGSHPPRSSSDAFTMTAAPGAAS